MPAIERMIPPKTNRNFSVVWRSRNSSFFFIFYYKSHHKNTLSKLKISTWIKSIDCWTAKKEIDANFCGIRAVELLISHIHLHVLSLSVFGCVIILFFWLKILLMIKKNVGLQNTAVWILGCGQSTVGLQKLDICSWFINIRKLGNKKIYICNPFRMSSAKIPTRWGNAKALTNVPHSVDFDGNWWIDFFCSLKKKKNVFQKIKKK